MGPPTRTIRSKHPSCPSEQQDRLPSGIETEQHPKSAILRRPQLLHRLMPREVDSIDNRSTEIGPSLGENLDTVCDRHLLFSDCARTPHDALISSGNIDGHASWIAVTNLSSARAGRRFDVFVDIERACPRPASLSPRSMVGEFGSCRIRSLLALDAGLSSGPSAMPTSTRSRAAVALSQRRSRSTRVRL